MFNYLYIMIFLINHYCLFYWANIKIILAKKLILKKSKIIIFTHDKIKINLNQSFWYLKLTFGMEKCIGFYWI